MFFVSFHHGHKATLLDPHVFCEIVYIQQENIIFLDVSARPAPNNTLALLLETASSWIN